MDIICSTITVFLVILATGFCSTEIPKYKCDTKTGNVTCVKVTLCPYVLKLIDNQQFETLSKLNCGFEGKHPKVCCPKGEVPIVYNVTEETATNRPKPVSTIKPKITTTFATTFAPNISKVTEKYNKTIIEEKDKTFPSKEVCGKSSGVVDRIVGGTITQVNEHPWLARIRYKIDDVVTFGCSAALITDRFLLTAAHCVIETKPIGIRLGEWNTKTEMDCYKNICHDSTIDVNISKVIIHPKSNISKADGDIAVIKLNDSVTFTDFIQPICLPTTRYIAMQDYSCDDVYFAAGWGQTEFESESVVKRQVQLKAAPIEVCRNIYNLKAESEHNIICAGGSKGKDTCRGDSGGPLVKLVSENYEYNWYVFGITSLGIGTCGSEGVPGIYTRVSVYMDWIRAIVSKL